MRKAVVSGQLSVISCSCAAEGGAITPFAGKRRATVGGAGLAEQSERHHDCRMGGHSRAAESRNALCMIRVRLPKATDNPNSCCRDGFRHTSQNQRLSPWRT
jgi:hypothetical protein